MTKVDAQDARDVISEDLGALGVRAVVIRISGVIAVDSGVKSGVDWHKLFHGTKIFGGEQICMASIRQASYGTFTFVNAHRSLEPSRWPTVLRSPKV